LKHSLRRSAFCFIVAGSKKTLKGTKMKEIEISRAIIEQYCRRLSERLENDVVIVGAGPAGLAAAYYLSKAKIKTTVVEKKLSVGGGIWGGAAGYNVVTFEDTDILDEIAVTTKKDGDLYTADAIEFAVALAYKAKKAGAEIFNLTEAEDIVVKEEAVKGVVVNSTSARMVGLHVDPFCICARYTIDATGHPAELVGMLKKRKPELFPKELQEYFMNVETSEAGVVEKTGQVYPGLYVAGMSVCDVFNLPRMGPIFGGMLKSGKKVAELIVEKMQSSDT
jgi:thiazole biosynthesis enzyme